MYKKIVSIIFLIVIVVGLCNMTWSNKSTVKSELKNLVKNRDIKIFFTNMEKIKFGKSVDDFIKRNYSKAQLLLGKREIGNFTYYIRDDGGLIIMSKTKKFSLEQNYDVLKRLYSYSNKNGISFLDVIMPEEVNGDDIELLKNIDNGNYKIDQLTQKIEGEIPYLDLRTNEEVSNLAQNYYKTDHHWDNETCFYSFKAVIEDLAEKYEQKYDPNYIYTNIENYTKNTKENCFYGSKGLNVGEVYLSKEDFSILVPNFETKFKFEKYEKGKLTKETEGRFEETFIDDELLNDESYMNKYNVFLYGTNDECRISNNSIDSKTKALLIGPSYGRMFAPYLSTCFKETRYIDPQEGRFEGDVMEYIKDYGPDVIILLNKAYNPLDF